MKNIYKVFTLFILVFFSVTTTNAQSNFCVPTVLVPIITTNVEFSDINNPSDHFSSDGYEDFTLVEGNVSIGETYNLIAESNNPDDLYLQVYIDWNQNQNFEQNEFYGGNASSIGSFTQQIQVPQNATVGKTIMRVIAQDDSTFNPCGPFTLGQVEDYTLNVNKSASTPSFNVSEVTIYPDPTTGIFNVETDLDIKQIEVYNLSGQRILKINQQVIDLQSAANGLYLVTVITSDGAQASYKLIKN